MRDKNIIAPGHRPGVSAVLIHLGLASLGVAAWLTGGLADDYKKMAHYGFTLHSWIGAGAAGFILTRFFLGVLGARDMRFSQWVPCTKERLIMVREDVAGLLRFRLPERATHQGLAGLVQTFGLAVFLLMALTGGFLFLSLEPGQKARGLAHTVKELHEAGQLLIPLFLSVHAGAVTLHALRGRHLWRRMFLLKETSDTRAEQCARVVTEHASDAPSRHNRDRAQGILTGSGRQYHPGRSDTMNG